MSNLVMCLLACKFTEVQKLVKTNGETIKITKADQCRLKKLRKLLNLLHNAGHLS